MLWLVRFAFSKEEEEEEEEEDGQSVKIVYLYFTPPVIFSSIVLHAVTFHMFSTLMSLEDRLN